ncbi:MAB_1171c family putative transporter [Streptomyces sp. NEAU-S7GS2]|uniref:MAB_1171c family putative transporter n=1 Tax=Streptomyces sp. NEAU-S7GS2 TaxID=2202000 RepID=UPI0031BBC802
MPELIKLSLLYPCWAVVVVRVSALRSREQRPVWFALLMLALGMTMLQEPTERAARHLIGLPHIVDLVSSLMAVGVATTLLTFAARSYLAGGSFRIPFRRSHLISCGMTIGIMIVTFSIVTIQRIPMRDRFLPIPGTFTAHSIYWATYLTYMLIATGITTALLIIIMRMVHSRLVRIPVTLLAIASIAFMIFLGSRVVAVFTYSTNPIEYGTYISSVHTVGVALGCSIAAFTPIIQGFASWRKVNILYPMWKGLCTALPHIALYPPRSRLVDALLPHDSQLRLHRRLVEIRDGLLIMHGWASRVDIDHILAVIAEEEVPRDQTEAVVTACWLKVALAAHRAGLPHADHALDLARRGGSDRDSELDWLREVANVWSTPLVERCVSAVNARRPQEEKA